MLPYGKMDHSNITPQSHRKENHVLQDFQGWLTSSKPENKDDATITMRKEGWMKLQVLTSQYLLMPPVPQRSLISPTYGTSLAVLISLMLSWGFQASFHGYSFFLRFFF